MVETFCENPLLISEVNQLPASSNLEVTIVDDKSLVVIERIEKLLSAFEPMGFDELRYVYIEAVRGKIEEWCTYEEYRQEHGGRMKSWKKDWKYHHPISKEWYQVGIRRYRELVFIYISRRYRGDVVIGNTKDVYTPREQVDSYRYDLSSFLTKLEAYLTAVVESIQKDSEGYIRYLEDNYPYRMRTGKIPIKDWCRIIKEKMLVLDDESYKIVKELSARKPESAYLKLTLREYMRIWKIAYTSLPEHRHLKDSSLEEVFRHSSKGDLRQIQGYDWDSETDFHEWGKKNSSFHCYDVCYARVHLFVQSDGGSYYLELAAHYEGWIDILICIAVALYKAGVPFVLRDAEELLALHHQVGNVVIKPGYHYGRSFIGSPDRYIPEVGRDGVTQKQIDELISTIEWDRFKEVKPIQK